MATRSRYVFLKVQSGGRSSCAWKMVVSILPRCLCVPDACDVGIATTVILREKLALKSLDVVDETRAKWT